MKTLRAYFASRRQPVLFIIAGGYNTLFGYLVFAAGYYWLGERLHYLVIATLAHILAITNAFLCHRLLVFRSTRNIFLEYLKYHLVYGVSYLIGLVLMYLGVEMLGLHPLLCQALVLAILALLNYQTHKTFTFPPGAPPHTPDQGSSSASGDINRN